MEMNAKEAMDEINYLIKSVSKSQDLEPKVYEAQTVLQGLVAKAMIPNKTCSNCIGGLHGMCARPGRCGCGCEWSR